MSLHIVSNSFSQKNRIPIIHKKYVQKNKYKKKNTIYAKKYVVNRYLNYY